ncbi:MAG: hypothetical protein HGA44_05905 [Cellulomonadaceae bacterium]|nr:hypothetical protein [Cellulomonadaceae bacterium]
MRAWAVLSRSALLGALLLAVGVWVGGVAGRSPLSVVMAVALVLLGVWRLAVLPRAGASTRDGLVLYKAASARTVPLRPGGLVEVRPRLFLPFVYLQELVVRYPDGSVVSLPWASTSSWRRDPSDGAVRSRDTLQAWLDEAI